MIGLDLSDWSVVPTAEQVASLAGVGITFAVVGTSYANPSSGEYVATDQIAAFESAGWPVSEYQFPGHTRVTSREWYADAENDLATADSLRQCLRSGAAGPYSRVGWASENLPDWDCKAEFPDAKLWDARYVHLDSDPCPIAEAVANNGDIAAAIQRELSWLHPFQPYWGFTEAAITQWHNSITLFGVNVDLNVLEGAMTYGPTIDEFRALFAYTIAVGNAVTALGNGLMAVAQTAGTDHAVIAQMQADLDALKGAAPK